MAFKWGSSLGGAAKGAAAGSPFGPVGMGIGGVLGALGGGFNRDIDKKITGNSGSGMTNNALNIAGLAGGGYSLLKGGGSGLSSITNMFSGGGAGGAKGAGSSMGQSGMPLNVNPLSLLSGNFTPSYGSGSSQMASSAAKANGQESSWNSLFGGKGETLLTGLGLMGASNMFKSPQVPQTPDSVRRFQETASQGSPLSQLATQRSMEQLNQPFEGVSGAEEEAALRQIQQAKEDEIRQLTGTYKSLRPGSDITTDSSYAKDIARINDRYARTEADTIAQLHRQVYNDFQGQRAQQILTANGVDANRLAALAQAGQVDLDQVLRQFNIEDRDKEAIRNLLLQTGANVGASALDPNYNMNQTFNKYMMDQLMKKTVATA